MFFKKPKLKSGFTLVELLVVMAVIAALTGLLVTVVGTMITTARVKATQATIVKIHGLLTERIQAFERTIEEMDATSSPPRYAQPYMLMASNDVELAKLIGRLELFRELFPQDSSEAGLSGVSSENSSAAALYYFLLKKEDSSYNLPIGESDFFTSSEINVENGHPYLIDSYGNPIRFYRWPTRLIRPNGNPASIPDLTQGGLSLLTLGLPTKTPEDPSTNPQNALNQDPNDPLEIQGGLITEVDYYTPQTWHVPLIVSAGPDENLGLYEPQNTTQFGHLAMPETVEQVYDNLSNHNFARGEN